MEQCGEICILVRSLWLQRGGLTGGRTADRATSEGAAAVPQVSNTAVAKTGTVTERKTDGRDIKEGDGQDTVSAWLVGGWERGKLSGWSSGSSLTWEE